MLQKKREGSEYDSLDVSSYTFALVDQYPYLDHPLVNGTFKSNMEVTGDLITRHWVMSQLDLRVGVSRSSIGGLKDDGLRGIPLLRRVGNAAPRAGAVVRCVGGP